MNRQEVFDRVATHLLTQNERSTTEEGTLCAYRGATGMKCAVGVLISDEAYSPDFEGQGATCEDIVAALKASGVDLRADDARFLRRLQSLHDSIPPREWDMSLQQFARVNRLSSAVLNTIPAAA